MNCMSSGELIHGHRSGNRNRCHAGWLKGRFQPYWYQLTVDNERVSRGNGIAYSWVTGRLPGIFSLEVA